MNPEPLKCELCNKKFNNCRNKTKRFCSEKCRLNNYNLNYYKNNKLKFIEKEKKRYHRLYGKDLKYTNLRRIRALSNYKHPKKGICIICGFIGNTDLHHFKYEIDTVMEVCKPCHKKIHHL